jgi:sugar lactone lactonase YvrE
MKFRTLAEGLQFPEGPVAMPDGSVLLVEIAAGTLTRIGPDGTRTTVAAHRRRPERRRDRPRRQVLHRQ